MFRRATTTAAVCGAAASSLSSSSSSSSSLSAVAAVRAAVLVFAARGAATSSPRLPLAVLPPLTVLSWSVDGAEHTHRRCRRRLPRHLRVEGIAATVRATAPDVVALQDSTDAVAAALTAPPTATATSSDTAAESSPVVGELGAQLAQSLAGTAGLLRRWSLPPPETTAQDGAVEGDDSADVGQPEGEQEREGGVVPEYVLIGASSNGRCGSVQVFARVGSPWVARLLPACPGVTVELSCDTADGAPRTAFTLTNLDLSYRGRSLAARGVPLRGAAVSRDGSPFSLTHGDSSSGGGGGRPGRAAGELDPHRSIALDFVARVTRPSLLVGNLFMGREEAMASGGKNAYADAWTLAGSPAHQERTLDTFHRRPGRGHAQAQTNTFYFVPSPGVGGGRERRDKAAGGGAALAVEGDGATVGSAVPLSAWQAAAGEWVMPTAPPSAGDEDTTHPHPPLPHMSSSSSVGGIDAWVQAQLAADGAAAAAEGAVGIPEVAGRPQRCFIRRYAGGPAATRQQQQSVQQSVQRPPVSQVFRRCRVVVPRPLLSVSVGPVETAWRARLRSPRRRRKGSPPQSDGEEEVDSSDSATGPGTVPCSIADQYPLLVHLS